MKSIYTCVAGLLLSLGCASTANAQSIFSLSELNRSARSLGMGGTSGVTDANAFSIYDNASKAAFSKKTTEFGVQYSPWAKNLTDGMDSDNLMINVGGYYSLDEANKLLLGVTYYAPGGNDMFETDMDGNVIGGKIEPSYFSASLGYARRLGDNWGVSAAVNYALWNPGVGDKISAAGVDLSATRRFAMSQSDFFDLSFKASGWGAAFTDLDGYKLPGLVSVGGLYNKNFNEKHALNLAVDLGARCLDESAFNASAGLEYDFNRIFFVRGGYHYTSYENDYNGFASLGGGVRLFNTVQADFSYLLAGSDSPLKNTFMVGLNVQF